MWITFRDCLTETQASSRLTETEKYVMISACHSTARRYDGMVDIADLKSAGGDSVPVRVRLAAPFLGADTRRLNALSVLFLLQNANNCIGRIDLSIFDLLEERVIVDDETNNSTRNYVHA